MLRMVWFLVAASIIAYAVYLLVGSMQYAEISGESQPITIVDDLRIGEHHLSGMLVVASSCDQITLHTETVSTSTNVYKLVFRTIREDSVDCTPGSMPRYFRTKVSAPSAGSTFVATLDGKNLPMTIRTILPERN